MTGMGIALALGLLLPAAGYCLNRAVGAANRPGVRVMGPVVVLASFACFAIAALANGGGTTDFVVYRWLDAGITHAGLGVPAVAFDLYFDPLSAVMTLVITGVGFLIHAYAAAYMEGESDASYARFFAHMNLFIFSMLLLVLAHNFVFLTIGWGMVGVSSYLLIGFYHERPAAVLAARKAFVMNVIGDVGIVIASFIAFASVGGVGFDQLLSRTGSGGGEFQPVVAQGTLELIAFFLLVGAVAKSAQVPLHTWLPDAMEGPTPVSALIHAATMVTAGVYLVARMHPLFASAPRVAALAAVIGAVTALMAGVVACVQNDIKRILAYSTMSQVGYMFFAVSIGAEVAGIFHLMTHAFFKALLFLAAGNVIHAMGGEQDIRRMGGLWHELRTTRWLFLVGTFALAGMLPLSGFFSKDEIIAAGFTQGPLHPLGGIILLLVTGLTAYYMLRAFLVTFMGERTNADAHPHELTGAFVAPLMGLAALAAFGGLLQPGPWHLLTDYLRPPFADPREPALGVVLLTAVLSLLAVLAGMFAAYAVFAPAPQRRAARSNPLVLERAFFWDRLYDTAVVRPLWAVAEELQLVVETPLVIGITDAVADIAAAAGQQVRRLQSGYVRSYAMVFAAGALVVVVVAGMTAR
ncbi:MAG: NADH-quinone oxidoreductase subunit L [Candidatus Dormibacteria bacterium]